MNQGGHCKIKQEEGRPEEEENPPLSKQQQNVSTAHEQY